MKRGFLLSALILLLGGILPAASVQRALAADPSGRPVMAAQATFPAPSGALAAQPGRNDRFYAVQAKLDPGGSFYFYSDLKGGLRAFMDQVKLMLSSNPAMPPEASRVYAVADEVVNRLGLYGIYDLGISVIPDGNLNRAKCYISAPEGRQNGLLAVLGGQPHPFSALDRASSSTLVVIDADNDTAVAWKLIRQIILDIGGLNAQAQVDQTLAKIKAQSGLDLEAMNASLAGNCCFFIDQDPAAQLMLPIPGAPLNINAPRLALMVKVKDARFYDSLRDFILKKAGPQAHPEATEGKLKYVELNAANPFWPVFPALATDGHYVYLSSHLAYIKQLASPAGPLLRDTAEFKALAAGLPAMGNGLSYVSPRLGDLALKTLSSIANAQTMANPMFKLDQVLAQIRQSHAGSMTVRVNESDGVLVVSRSKAGAAQFMAGMAVPAILPAIAIPNFIDARERSMEARARADKAQAEAAAEKAKASQKASSPTQMNQPSTAPLPPASGMAPGVPGVGR